MSNETRSEILYYVGHVPHLVGQVETFPGACQLAIAIHHLLPAHASLHVNNVQLRGSYTCCMFPQERVELHALHVLTCSAQVCQH